MNLGFLRPSVRKLILAAVLFAFTAPIFQFDNGIRCITTPCPAGSQAPLPVALLSTYSLFGKYFPHAIYGIDHFQAPFWLAVSYVAAALAADFREKRAKRKKTN